MNMQDLIQKKRDGGKLTKDEIEFFVKGYTEGTIPDYQVSALLMAIYFQKMDIEETYALTRAMEYSGDVIDLSKIEGIKVDKHSTGGVGDKISLIAAPIAAAAGTKIAKMSGRGLGFTGGTVDKLESIPGYRTALSEDEFFGLVNSIGMSLIGQTAYVAPADKKIYALRDVTATVENLSLITSSIMSKKLASGSDAIVLDVKCGNGAFMESIEDAEKLASLMVEIGNADGKRTIAVLTDMNQPLGHAIGNSLEVIEAIETLKGEGPADITELSLKLAGLMIYLAEKAENEADGYAKAREALDSGKALEVFEAFVKGQGGDVSIIDDYDVFPSHSISCEAFASDSGYVNEIIAKKVGMASQHSGAGRATKEDTIDLSAGIYLFKKVGDEVNAGDVIAVVYGNDEAKVKAAATEVESAYIISKEKPEPRPLIIKTIGV